MIPVMTDNETCVADLDIYHPILAAAILDHHYLSAQNKIQHRHWIRPRAKIRVDANKCFYIDSTKSYIDFLNFSGGHLGSPLFIGAKQNAMLPLYF